MCVQIHQTIITESNSKLIKQNKSRSPTSWNEDDPNGQGNANPNVLSKANYADSIDTRSLSIDPSMDSTIKSGQNHTFLFNNQNERNDDANKTAAAGGHTNDTSKPTDNNRNKEHQSEYDVDGNTETETKSVSSAKSNGSNPELRYCICLISAFIFFSIFFHYF